MNSNRNSVGKRIRKGAPKQDYKIKELQDLNQKQKQWLETERERREKRR
jgi:hypothetical protein